METSTIDNQLQESLDHRVNNISLSIDNTKEALESSKKIGYLKGQAYAQTYLAFFYMIITKHQEAIPLLETASIYFNKENDKFGLAFTYNTYGSIHYKTDNYHLGLKYLLQSYELYKELKDVLNQSRTLKSIGSIYEFFKDYEKAKETYLKCISLSESINDYNGVSNALNPLSNIYLKENNSILALETIERSIQLKQQTKDKRGLGFAHYGKAKVYDFQNDIEPAESFYLSSLKIHLYLGEHVGAMMTLNKLGNMYIKVGKVDLAKQRLKECIKEGKYSHHNLIIYKAYFSLYTLSKNEGNIKEALNYLEKYNEFKDSIEKRNMASVLKSVQSISKIDLLEKEAHWHKEKTEEVEKKNKELDNFVYKVSHDLRGPISSLLGLYNVVKLDIEDEKSLKYFGMYQEQIQRLEKIILDFIDLTRIRESKIELSLIDFESTINQCIKAYNYMPNFDKINFQIQIEKNLTFYSDNSSVNSIIQNLIENSIKYASNRRSPFVKIVISKDSNSNHIIILVEDNGVGIQDDYKERVFDMFFRANSNIQGSGLGLYILKTATERLKGTIKLDSEYNKGSIFTITLPL